MADQTTLTPTRIWLLAIRPKTLPASIAGVTTGIAAAIMDGRFALLPACAALAVGILLQIASNLANDVFDFERGTDAGDRLGPPRVTQGGLLTPRQVKIGLGVVILLACIPGVYLVMRAGWLALLIGAAAITAAVLYTGGPFPLGYHGLGDLFVFLFFGLAAVSGTYLVQAGALTALAVWLSVPVGLIIVALLVVNNLRDIASDQQAGKRTLAVRMGKRVTRYYFLALVSAAYLVFTGLIAAHQLPGITLLSWLSAPEAVRITRAVFQQEGKVLNPVLAATSRLALVFALLFLVSVVVARCLPF